ncbi:hypothetical protein [Escherichia coli]|uniref:hypothetical protein n=1 Tax=Escherichia coli TaxID=562 RepID=UPI000BE54D24|nr:hypothetical protein [Escherichia coli]
METSEQHEVQEVQEGVVKHKKTRLLLEIENGEVIYSRHLSCNEFACSVDTFIWMLERAGYTIIPPAKEQTL